MVTSGIIKIANPLVTPPPPPIQTMPPTVLFLYFSRVSWLNETHSCFNEQFTTKLSQALERQIQDLELVVDLVANEIGHEKCLWNFLIVQ